MPHSGCCIHLVAFELPIRQVVPAERKTVLFVSSWVFHCLDSREGVPAYSLTKNAKQWFLLLVSRSLVAASAPLPFAVVAILVALPVSAFSFSFRTFRWVLVVVLFRIVFSLGVCRGGFPCFFPPGLQSRAS